MIEFLTRRGCHLCNEALALVHEIGLDVKIVDIDLDPRLLAEFDHRVPVIRDGRTGEIIAEGIVSGSDLRFLVDG